MQICRLLLGTDLEPRPAPGTQLGGLLDLGQGENIAVEGKALGFERPGHGDLDMVDADDAQRQVALRIPIRSLASPPRDC